MDPKSNPILPTYDGPPNAKNYMGTKFYNKIKRGVFISMELNN
jgi:hypothetical protein